MKKEIKRTNARSKITDHFAGGMCYIKNIENIAITLQKRLGRLGAGNGSLRVFPVSKIIFLGIGRLKRLVPGIGPEGRSLRIRHLALLFAMGMIYSILLASHNHHDGCVIRSDCPLCKFAIDSASADAVASAPSVMPDYTYTPLVEKNIVCFCGICPASLTSRAPPVSWSS